MLTLQSFVMKGQVLQKVNLANVRMLASSTCQMVEYKRVTVRETESIREHLNSPDFKPRKSSTMLHLPKVSLPDQFVQYVRRIFQHENITHLQQGANNLTLYLRNRQPPIEEDEYRAKVSQVEDDIKAKDSFLEPFLSEEQLQRLESSRDNKIRKRLRESIYHWEPIEFDHSKALQYLIARAAPNYAALSRVFSEIAKRDPKFAPASMLDFGSGIGSVLWAARHFWSSSLIEHMCVDTSREMNEIAELLTRRGMSSREPFIPGVYFRQFFPVGAERKYDLTVSSFSLMELPSARTRMETLDTLWRNTRKYLVLIEPGSNAGFELINEARDFLLQTYSKQEPNVTDEANDHIKKRNRIAEGYTFAPCPNDVICPRYSSDTTPCNFNVRYRPMLPFDKDFTDTEVFCYLVLKKGPRPRSDEQWPRLVRDPLRRGKHIICRLCTKNGVLEETVLTKRKHLRPLYATARRSLCGDLLPVIEVEPAEGNELGDDEPEEVWEEGDSSESEDERHEKKNSKTANAK